MLWPILLVGAFGLFTINLPVTLSSYARTVLRTGADGYGLLSAATAAGALIGALLSTQRTHISPRALYLTGAVLAALYLLASFAPTPWALVAFLAPIGGGTTMLNTATNTTVQLAADDTVRGRVMGVYVLVFVGCGALGGPLLGAVDQASGPDTGLRAAGIIPALACALLWLTRRARRQPATHRAEAPAPVLPDGGSSRSRGLRRRTLSPRGRGNSGAPG
jgi:MFS family permease